MLDDVTNSGGETLGDVFPAFGVSAFGAYDVRGVIGELEFVRLTPYMQGEIIQ